MTTKTRPLKAGDRIHILAARGVLLFGLALRRGDELEVTQAQLDSSRDRLDRSWCDDVSENAQRDRWGEVRIGLGPWPEDTPKLVPGSVEHAEAREAARRAAWAITNPEERAAALQRVSEDYGPLGATSRTVGGPTDPALRAAADEERDRRRAEAAKAPRKPRDPAQERSLDELLDLGRAEAWDRSEELRETMEDRGLR